MYKKITTYCIKGKIKNLVSNVIPRKQRPEAIEDLKKVLELPNTLFYEPLCSVSKIPALEDHYYDRALSILVKLIRNPSGIKRITKWYSRKKTSTVKRKTKNVNARKKPVRIIVNSLFENELVAKTNPTITNKSKPGYYTTEKGRKIIEKWC